MLQRIESKLVLSVRKGRNGELIDFSNARHLLFCVKQEYGVYMEFPAQYTDGKLLVTIPYKDAMKLTTSPTKGQLCWTDEYGNKKASLATPLCVEELLRETGYE